MFNLIGALVIEDALILNAGLLKHGSGLEWERYLFEVRKQHIESAPEAEITDFISETRTAVKDAKVQ